MPEEAKTKWVPQYKPVSVTRNDIELSFPPAQVKKGDDKGTEYLGPPEVKVEDAGKLMQWIGVDNWLKKTISNLRTLAQGWWFEAVDQATDKDSGQLNVDKAYDTFKQLAAEFSARGESIVDLKAQVQELIDQIGDADATAEDYAVEVAKLAQQIKALNVSIASKKRKTKAEKEAEAAEAKATANA